MHEDARELIQSAPMVELRSYAHGLAWGLAAMGRASKYGPVEVTIDHAREALRMAIESHIGELTKWAKEHGL